MPIKIKNWKIAIFALISVCILMSLGFWQLSRAKQKIVLLESFNQRMSKVLSSQDLQHKNDWRFYQATLSGRFDNAHTMLLDNKIKNGQVGYEVYTPFITKDLATPILIDRGFISMGTRRRSEIPQIQDVNGKVTIKGLLNLPPAYFALGKLSEVQKWPLLIEYVNLQELAALRTDTPGLIFYPYILTLTPHHAGAYDIEWQIVTMSPEKHYGYAVQWFALALTLLILFVVLNRERPHP